MRDYMNDEELMQFILDIENNELVDAPPTIAENVFEKIDKKNQIVEYKRFRNRVITAIACIWMLVVIIPAFVKLRPSGMTTYYRQSEERIDLADSKIFGRLCDTHYMSDLFNGREE